MHIDLQEIEIKQLVVISGESGLWKVRQLLKNGEFLNAINITSEKIKTVPTKRVNAINNFMIYTNEEQLPLDTVINNIMTLSETEAIPAGNGFKKLDAKFKSEFMEKIAPDYSNEFKDYHVEKILKWYEELQKYFDVLNKDVEDL